MMWFMEMINKFSSSFFEKSRPNVREINKKINPDEKVIPIEWSKDVLEGKKKVKITLPNKK